MPKPQITNKPEWKEIRMNKDGEKMFQIFYVGKFTKPNGKKNYVIGKQL
jgi:hypothetical protein